MRMFVYGTSSALVFMLCIAGCGNPEPVAVSEKSSITNTLIDTTEWRWISMDEATLGEIAQPTRLEFSIPTYCVVSNKYKNDSSYGFLLGDATDLVRVQDAFDAYLKKIRDNMNLSDAALVRIQPNSFSEIERGVYSVALSTDVGYFQETGKFSCENADAEKQLKHAGITDGKVQRTHAGDYPLLIIQGKIKGRGFYRCYVGTLHDTWVITLNYNPPKNLTGNEDAEWHTTINSLRIRADVSSGPTVQQELNALLPQVAQRLTEKKIPVVLTDRETSQLISALRRGPALKEFNDPELEPQVRAYWTDGKGRSAKAITFARIAKDGTWYTTVGWDMWNGEVMFHSGGGKTDGPSALIWKVEPALP